MRIQRWIGAAVLAVFAFTTPAAAQRRKKTDGPPFEVAPEKKKKNEEPPTQTLPLLKDPPLAVTADSDRLTFLSAPLSGKGLLSQQVRDALKALLRDSHGATIVKLRAFVAGTGDMRRVQTILSETFTEKKLSLPALTTVQAGALPGDGVQLALEAIAVDKKVVNPHGLAFISGQPGPTPEKSIGGIQAALQAAGIGGTRVLRATCFLSSLEDSYTQTRTAVTAAFPSAAVNFVQMQRGPVSTPIECEAVAALERPVGEPARLVNPESLTKSPAYTQMVLVSAQKLVITGSQMGFHAQDADVRLAFERLGKALDGAGATFHGVVYSHLYPLAGDIAEKIRAIRFDYYDKARPPAGTMLPFEALPSLDASFAIDVIAVLGK